MCAHRVDFTLSDSEDGSSLLLNIAVFRYELHWILICCRTERTFISV